MPNTICAVCGGPHHLPALLTAITARLADGETPAAIAADLALAVTEVEALAALGEEQR